MDTRQAQGWVDDFLAETPRPAARSISGVRAAARPAPLGIAFSPFIPEHTVAARELSRQLMIAGRDGDLDAVRAAAAQMTADNDPALVRFALKLFVTHSPAALPLRIPALETRAPLKVVPSRQPARAAAPLTGEALLDWWREDPEANEHHDHWHVVYPGTGIADPTDDDPDRTRLLSRQGELFFYMHQQMLARYDHERLAVGLGPVEPFADYDGAIRDG